MGSECRWNPDGQRWEHDPPGRSTAKIGAPAAMTTKIKRRKADPGWAMSQFDCGDAHSKIVAAYEFAVCTNFDFQF